MDENLTALLKKEYDGIEKIDTEESALLIYADDDTLWKILEDKRDQFNMEFEAGVEISNFLKIHM